MIIQEELKDNLVKTYSNKNMYIKQVETGIKYATAVDIKDHYSYTETTKPIEIDIQP